MVESGVDGRFYSPDINRVPPGNLFKVEHTNIPLGVPKDWVGFFDEKAEQLGITRNAALRMALRLGGPMLEAHCKLMRDSIRSNCTRIARGNAVLSEILAPTGNCEPVLSRRRARKTDSKRARKGADTR